MPNEVTVDARPMPQGGVDPNIHLPPSARAAAAAADAIHAQVYGPQQPQPGQTPNPQGTINFTEPTYNPPGSYAEPWKPPVQPQTQPQNISPQPVSTNAENSPQPDPKAAERSHWTPEQWQHYAASMEGRLRKTREELQTYQAEVVNLGDEVARSQQNLRQPQNPPQQQPRRFLTPEDQETYGESMVDFARRAALDAVSPVLTNLQKQNEALQKRIQRSSATTVESTLDTAVPNWREINTSPQFKAWLRLRDIYSREVKQELLNKAYGAGDASTVAKFFQGYLAENPDAQGENYNPLLAPQAGSQPATRQAAVPIENLTAPGHARPTSGQPVVDAGAPAYITHAQVSRFYDLARQAQTGRGPYAGNEQARMNDEAFIHEMGNKGLIR